MANYFIKKQLDFIVDNTDMTDIYEIDRVRYCLEVFYGETSKVLIMLLISLLLDKLLPFLLMISLLMLIRPFIGGSHSKNFLSCLIKSNLAFIAIYYLASIITEINIFIQIIILAFSIIIVRKFKPINRIRKKIKTQYNNLQFKNIVTIILILWFLISNLLLTNYYINCGLLIILYIILDFFKEVYKNEKEISC